MSFILEDLIINRVDLVDEGANSAAFIELYKRKEKDTSMDIKDILAKMKPEHAEVIQAAIDEAAEALKAAQEELESCKTERDEATQERDKAMEDLNTANEDLEATKTELEQLREADKAKEGASFDETETFKSMPEEVKEMFKKMKAQKEAAEAEVAKAKEAEKEAEAVAKAKELKAIPFEHEKLVGIVKSADAELLDFLSVVNTAFENAVLNEVGKSHASGAESDAWTKIEAKADEVAKRDNVTKAKAISIAIKENPELYKEYLQGGAN